VYSPNTIGRRPIREVFMLVFRIFAALLFILTVSSHAQQPSAPPAPPGTRLQDLAWPAAEQRLRSDSVVVLPLGAAAVEHGPHLKLRSDAVIAEYLTRRIVELSDVIVAPPLPYHYFPAFQEYPGSTSLSMNTARDLTVEVARSLARFGPRRFYVINTGLSSAEALAESAKSLVAEGVLLRYTDLNTRLLTARATQRQPGGNHADELETSMMLYIDPSSVDMAYAVRDYTSTASTPFRLTRRQGAAGTYSPTGSWGDPTLATRDKGQAIVEGLVTTIRGEIEELRRAVPPLATALNTPADRFTPTGRGGRGEGMGGPDECLPGDDRAIRSLGPGFGVAWREQDALRLSRYWASGGDMIHPDGLVETTAQVIRQNRAYLFQRPEYKHSRHWLQIGVIRCITSDVAVAECKWELSGVTDGNGQTLPPAEGICTLVLERGPGGWAIEAYRYTMKSPGSQPTILKRPGPTIIR
jgi:creatinine amidohydrolase